MGNNFLHGGKIMKGYIRAQAIAFGDFSTYNVDSKSIYDLLGKFSKYDVIPNVIDEMQIEIRDNVPIQKVVKRVQLNSIKDRFSIKINGDNIIIEALTEVDINQGKINIEIENFIKKAIELFGVLLGIISTKFNRISLVTTYLDESNPNNQYDRYVKPDGFFKDKNVFEWNIRSATREKVSDLNNEDINIICNIFKTQGVIGSAIPSPNNYPFDGVLREIDINTIPENSIYRIDNAYIEHFYNIASLKMREIERMMEDGK